MKIRGRLRDQLGRDAYLARQPCEVLETIGDHEGMHAGSDSGNEVFSLITAGEGPRRIYLKVFAHLAESGGLVIVQRDMD
jgi:hypothetical protein